MKYYLSLVLFGILVAGCSPADLFSQLAVSDVEQSAAESVAQSEALNKKIETIDQYKKSFFQTAELGLVRADMEAAAFAFRNNFEADNKTVIQVEALLADPPKFYEVWLLGNTPEQVRSLGPLTYRGPQDFWLTYEDDEDTSQFSQIIITSEQIADDIPEERVLIGTFSDRVVEN